MGFRVGSWWAGNGFAGGFGGFVSGMPSCVLLKIGGFVGVFAVVANDGWSVAGGGQSVANGG